MNFRRLTILLAILLLSLSLSACAGAAATSWPGISADVEAEVAYVAYNTGVFALNLNNGSLIWTYPAERNPARQFYTAPQLTPDGALIVGAYDRSLHSISTTTGSSNWVYDQTGNRFIGAPLVTDDTIYAPNVDEKVYALDFNANAAWAAPFTAQGPLWSTPVIDAGGQTLYVACQDSQLYAINANNGDLIWQTDIGGASVGYPALDEEDNRLYIGTFANKVLAIDLTSGDEIWSADTQNWVWASATVFDGQVLAADLSGNLYAFNASNGAQNWLVTLGGRIVAKPLIKGESIYIGTELGKLHALSLDGETRWSVDIPGNLYSDLVDGGDVILVGSSQAENIVVAIDTEGRQVWTFAYPQ